ncbi:hypothetical protein CYMTET_31679 [Cymbomonas tetramitiformis]|uniref:Uncharacterized protein n=1 Tax=Cymbomonas tetramitiformis TaxID=36881 RepID=A0AAE0FH27_9CHLO|nr:hypothetical protein CYMTET_31679 [Cymbomonas tetramitiformis]
MADEQKGLVSANVADQQPDMNKQFAALAKEIKDKLAQDMDDIKSRVSSSSASARGLSDDEEEVGVSRAAMQEEFEGGEEPLSAAQGHVHVSLGSTKKMQGFTPMTAEEHQEGNPLRAQTQVAAVLHQEGRLNNNKKSSKVLAAIDEINTTANLALDVRGAQEDCMYEGEDLPELTDGDDSDSEDGFLDQEDHEIAEHRTCASWARASPRLKPNGCQDGVAGTISMEGCEDLKKVTGQALDGEQRQRMNQVQPVCKLKIDSLEQGMALISAGGELVLSPAILMESGANCNIIPPRMVKKLGLKGMPMDVEGSHVARCDGRSAQFRELQLRSSEWTGPMMNSLNLSLDLFKSVATCWAGVSSKGGQPVTLPLARPNVYKPGSGPKRKENPLACFQTEIYASMAQQPEHQAEMSAAAANKVLGDEDMCDAYHALVDVRSPLNTLDQMTVVEMSYVNVGQDSDRLAILPDFKRQRQMPFRRMMRLGIVTGNARDDNEMLTFLFLNPQLHMEQADVTWQHLCDTPNIWELDQPVVNPEYYEGCWVYDFSRSTEYQTEVPISAIDLENLAQETLQKSIEFKVPIGPTKMILLYDVSIRRVVYLTQALHHQLEMAAKMTSDLVDEPRGGPLIFTYMVGAEEVRVPVCNRSVATATWPAGTWQWITRPLKHLYRLDLKTLQGCFKLLVGQ